MPQISVVIPTFNRERFVVKAIDSVLAQTFTDYEIIVIDDGSTDNTRKSLEAYADKIHYTYQENAGVSSARNTGTMQAKGPWVAFLDSDDEWNPDYLSSQYERIKEFPKAVAHMTNAFSVSLEMERIGLFTESNFLVKFGTKEYLVLEKPLALVIEHAMWFLQSSVMRRDSLLRAGLFDAGLSIAEDLDVIARMALEGPFTISKRELVEVFRRDEAIENLMAQSLKRGTYRHKAFGKVYDSLLSRGDLTRQEYTAIKRKQGQNLRALGNMLVLANRKAEARHSYMRSLLLHPSVRSLIKCVITYLPGNLSDTLVRKRKDILPGE